jgi:nucleoid-associated protein EbfC
MSANDNNVANIMKEAQKLQQRMQEAQNELTKLVVRGEAGGGLVKIDMNGRHDILEVDISNSLLNEDVEMIGDLVKAAGNDAVKKVEKASKEKISKLTSDINIPDFLKEADEE